MVVASFAAELIAPCLSASSRDCFIYDWSSALGRNVIHPPHLEHDQTINIELPFRKVRALLHCRVRETLRGPMK
jgi:hypothetical protein